MFFQNFTGQLTKFYKAIYTLLPIILQRFYKKNQQNKFMRAIYLQKILRFLTNNFSLRTQIEVVI